MYKPSTAIFCLTDCQRQQVLPHALPNGFFEGGSCLGFGRGEAGRRGFGKRSYSFPNTQLSLCCQKDARASNSLWGPCMELDSGTEVQHLVITFRLLVAKPDPDSVSPFVKQG